VSDKELEYAKAAWLAASAEFVRIADEIAEHMAPISGVPDAEVQRRLTELERRLTELERRLTELERRKSRDLQAAQQKLDAAFSRYIQQADMDLRGRG
jgi:Skp family chaperone for outer membrane proteins